MLEELHIEPPYMGFMFLAESVRNPPVLKAHRHVELELNLVVSGEIRYVVEDRSYRFPAGNLLWLFPEQTHQLVDRTPDARYYVAVFRPELTAEIGGDSGYAALSRGRPPQEGVVSTALPGAPFEVLRQMMAEICAAGMDSDLLNREAGFGQSPGFRFRHTDPLGLNAGLKHLLLYAWRLSGGGARAEALPVLHPALRRALEWLGREEPPPRLEALARRCGVSPSTLSRLFRREMGIPLTQHRNSVMLARFMALRHGEPGRTILEAMHGAGFGSYAQFHRVFRRAYGAGPRDVL